MAAGEDTRVPLELAADAARDIHGAWRSLREAAFLADRGRREIAALCAMIGLSPERLKGLVREDECAQALLEFLLRLRDRVVQGA